MRTSKKLCQLSLEKMSSPSISVDSAIIHKAIRESNIELFRIFLMLMIISHHYVVNSGLTELYNPHEITWNMIFLELFGWGGKTGINCFLLITGYFMCQGRFTWRKFWKLVLELKFYILTIYAVFLLSGYETFQFQMAYKKLFSITMEFGRGFGGTYVCLFLLIPYLNRLISIFSKKEFERLLLILLSIQTVVSTFIYNSYYEYLLWYVTVYFVGSYIRLYPSRWMSNRLFINRMVAFSIVIIALSILVLTLSSFYVGRMLPIYYFVSDSNKILAVLSSVSFFLFFLNLKLKPSKIINTIASATFGILLIHTSGDTMRRFLWRDTFHNVDWYDSPYLVIHSVLVVLSVYIVCAIIDLVRIRYIERSLFSYFDKFKDRIKINSILS